MKFWNCTLSVRKIQFLAIISIFQWGIKIFGPKLSHLIFEVVNSWGFWGPEAMSGNSFKEKKVIPLIFTLFWIRSHLNKLDCLTPQDVYCVMKPNDFIYFNFRNGRKQWILLRNGCKPKEMKTLKILMKSLLQEWNIPCQVLWQF